MSAPDEAELPSNRQQSLKLARAEWQQHEQDRQDDNDKWAWSTYRFQRFMFVSQVLLVVAFAAVAGFGVWGLAAGNDVGYGAVFAGVTNVVLWSRMCYMDTRRYRFNKFIRDAHRSEFDAKEKIRRDSVERGRRLKPGRIEWPTKFGSSEASLVVGLLALGLTIVWWVVS